MPEKFADHHHSSRDLLIVKGSENPLFGDIHKTRRPSGPVDGFMNYEGEQDDE